MPANFAQSHECHETQTQMRDADIKRVFLQQGNAVAIMIDQHE